MHGAPPTPHSTPTLFNPFGGSAYKLLANRLKKVLDKLNFESQNAFVGDRNFFLLGSYCQLMFRL